LFGNTQLSRIEPRVVNRSIEKLLAPVEFKGWTLKRIGIWKMASSIDSSLELRLVKTAHNVSFSSLRKKSDPTLVSSTHSLFLRQVLSNVQEVILGTKICLLFLAIPVAIVAQDYNFGTVGIFSFCRHYLRFSDLLS